MTRRQMRGVAIAGIFGVSAYFIYIGLGGWTIKSMPAHYVGFMVIAIGVAAMFGVNIWKGGPLDPQNDPKPGNPDKRLNG